VKLDDPRLLADKETNAEAKLHALGWRTRRVGPDWVTADRDEIHLADESFVALLSRARHRKFATTPST